MQRGRPQGGTVVPWGPRCPPLRTVYTRMGSNPRRAPSLGHGPDPARASRPHLPPAVPTLPATTTKNGGNGYGKVSRAPVRRKEGKKSQPEERAIQFFPRSAPLAPGTTRLPRDHPGGAARPHLSTRCGVSPRLAACRDLGTSLLLRSPGMGHPLARSRGDHACDQPGFGGPISILLYCAGCVGLRPLPPGRSLAGPKEEGSACASPGRV